MTDRGDILSPNLKSHTTHVLQLFCLTSVQLHPVRRFGPRNQAQKLHQCAKDDAQT